MSLDTKAVLLCTHKRKTLHANRYSLNTLLVFSFLQCLKMKCNKNILANMASRQKRAQQKEDNSNTFTNTSSSGGGGSRAGRRGPGLGDGVPDWETGSRAGRRALAARPPSTRGPGDAGPAGRGPSAGRGSGDALDELVLHHAVERHVGQV